MNATVHQFPARFDGEGRRYEPWLDERKIADHFDVDPRTIRRWSKKGMPSIGGNGTARRYQIGPCEDWLKDRAS